MMVMMSMCVGVGGGVERQRGEREMRKRGRKMKELRVVIEREV